MFPDPHNAPPVVAERIPIPGPDFDQPPAIAERIAVPRTKLEEPDPTTLALKLRPSGVWPAALEEAQEAMSSPVVTAAAAAAGRVSKRVQQPLSQLPVLVERTPDSDSDFVLSDSVAIEFYLAGRADLLVDSGLRDSAREMELRNQMEDLHVRLAIYIYGAEAGREMAADKFKRLAKSFVDYHEEMLSRNGSNGHYFGSRTTYVDISLYLLLLLIRRPHEVHLPGREDMFSKDKAPGINRVYRAVKEDPLARPYVAWLEKDDGYVAARLASFE
ncbi:glutathione S-transferase [Ophiocordyceps camponoti-floridani]|uniref:Glutathione S-transferase n=1 Tax=Ophiocordyceps camponoti-floridani TaxID=2030778 RepID=A0A8H4Q8N7_9HYPO|nr:glutathione S-transferase [Ophiocordyceps camponoti-floridani]